MKGGVALYCGGGGGTGAATEVIGGWIERLAGKETLAPPYPR